MIFENYIDHKLFQSSVNAIKELLRTLAYSINKKQNEKNYDFEVIHESQNKESVILQLNKLKLYFLDVYRF